MVKILIFVLLAEITTSIAQILFKKTANSLGGYNLRLMADRALFMKRIFSSPMVWIGFFSMLVGLVLWLMALSRGALSFVFPVGSIQFIIILVMAHAFLGEKIDSMKLIGTLLVALGIVFITLS